MVALQLSAVAFILSELLRLELRLESRQPQGPRALRPEAVPLVPQRLVVQSPAAWPLPAQLLAA